LPHATAGNGTGAPGAFDVTGAGLCDPVGRRLDHPAPRPVTAVDEKPLAFIDRRAARRRCMRQTGTVKFYNSQKGYGFIKPDTGGNDVFVHVTAVERSGIGELNEGMRISFETEPDKRGKGPKAVDLQRAG
jgi:CspA family cold shock protein